MEKFTNFEEAQKTARKFVLNQKYKIYLPGPSNRSKRENFRQTRERLLAGGGLTASVVVKVMTILGNEIYFQKKVS